MTRYFLTCGFIYTVNLIGFSDCDMSFKTVTKGVHVVQPVGKDGQVNLDCAFLVCDDERRKGFAMERSLTW